MNIFAFVLAVVAAVVFLLVGDVRVGTRVRSGVSLGLFFLTVALVVQFCARAHGVKF